MIYLTRLYTLHCNMQYTHTQKVSVASVTLAFFISLFFSKTQVPYRSGEHDPFLQMGKLLHHWLSSWQIWEQGFFYLLKSFN